MANTEPPSLKDTIYMLNHVFLPPKLPQEDDNNILDRDITLCRFVYNASLQFANFLSEDQQLQWSIVSEMLKKLKTTRLLEKDILIDNILCLVDGDVISFHIQAQNAALILRRRRETMVFEAFEVSPPPGSVMDVEGKLICSYPGPAVELPLSIAQEPLFVEQLVSFLVQMDVDRLNSEATTTKAGSKVPETRSTTHPRYITQLLMMILCGMGQEAQVHRITKRIADDVCWNSARNPWRRSSLWLVLRVAIQTTADSTATYKAFMVFFQTELFRLFLKHDISSDLLHAVRVKTSRRVHKLGASVSPLLLKGLEAISQEIGGVLQARWSKEQRQQAHSPSYTPDSAAFETDTTISLPNSRAYLMRIMQPDAYMPTTVTKFHPSHPPRLRNPDDFSRIYRDELLTKAVQEDPYVALADFESLVQERLDDWVLKSSQDESACKTLESLLEQYISAAQTRYSSNPEAESFMLLTIMELWLGLDTIAVAQCPLLSLYSPEIPTSFLDPLLLRRAKSIERAARIELYLRRRKSSATGATSVFSHQVDHTTFAVRYFRESPALQSVKALIERTATNVRQSKCAELQQMNARQLSLTQQSDELSCEYHEVRRKTRHSKSCRKCQLQKEADRMRINVHEWPLPAHPLEAEAVVFELNCPTVFAIWRRRTYQILRDIGMAHVKIRSASNHYLLEDYEGLANWSKKGTSGRITFGSETKSFLISHYRDVKIPTTEDKVCVNNGLRFRLYDIVKGECAFPSFNTNLDSYCTFQLPEDGEQSYRHLQYAVAYTRHSHNETIVKQGDCPMNLSMHEQLAFSNLRCGPHLQWKNIARELRMNVLTFSREEVHTLITQAAWQIGPLSDVGAIREWHFELGVPDFGLVLIREAKDLLSHVEANWMEGTTVKSIIYVTSRLLASTADAQQQVRLSGYTLLRKARDVTYRWMREIVHNLQDAVDDEASELQRRACEMAATCRATFDVDIGTHLHALLCSPADVAILLECAIRIHDNTPHKLGHTSPDFQNLLHRDRRLSHHLESAVNKLIHDDRRGLDTAISSVWSGYRPGNGGWQQLSNDKSRWLTSTTAPLPGQRAQTVHYNMLDGELLVDSRPVGRLPREIVGHSTYSRIFGEKFFDVIPADMPGMDYATRSLIYGYQFFFALSPQNLIIRARTASSQIFELVPHTILMADFPTFFVTKHVHWLDIHSGVVEFRPLGCLWDQSPQNWRLVFLLDGPSKMVHGTSATRHLVDIQSGTFNGIAACIRSLEYPEYLTMVYDVQLPHTVSIDLPRFRLSFFVNTSGELESKNMQGMIIADNQCTGTMIGLRSQLVLRNKEPMFAALLRSSCVLIPHGIVDFKFSPDRNHVVVDIDTHTDHRGQVRWYKYEIDSDLGSLVGNVNLTGRLFKIYLHALCSHPLPDPLTSQTGTTHALHELRAAGSFSFQRLTETDVELLRLIRNITPPRHYYPKHLRVMQNTNWSPNLPALSQHGAFETAVLSILQYAQSLTVFSGMKEKVELVNECDGNSFLMVRAMRRNSVYYEGGVKTSPKFDRRYESRDSPHITNYDSDGMEALSTSRLVYAWPRGLTCHLKASELLETFTEWGNLRGPTPDVSLAYTKEWLQIDLPMKWLSIYDLCRQIVGPSKKFELVFSFAALAYSNSGLRKFIPILLAFATISMSLLIAPPPHLSYDLSVGFEPVRKRVRDMISSGAYALANSPAEWLPQEPNESSKKFRSRQRMHYETISELMINNAADNLIRQWPCSTPSSPFYQSDDSFWFDAESIMGNIKAYFSSCSRNTDLLLFISQVTTTLHASYNATSQFTGVQIPRFRFVPQFNVRSRQIDFPFILENLLSSRPNSAPQPSSHEFGMGMPINQTGLGQPIDTSDLENLISQFQRSSHSTMTTLYSERLERSRRELHGQQELIFPEDLPPMEVCLVYRDQCRARLVHFFRLILSALAPFSPAEVILEIAGLWPRIHPRPMLQALASTANICLTPQWKKSLIAFAELFIEYQLSQRLVAYALRSEADNFFKELNGASMRRPDAESNPDWLLIQVRMKFYFLPTYCPGCINYFQIQGNFITRAVQADVAREMIAPSSSHNTVLQLNMGEGKSHVIVPLVAVALADSHKLVRVIVLKPLAGQMFQLLVERISGLTNRRIFYFPFSRDVKMDTQQIEHIRNLFEECARVQGVLLAEPEHILSFRLMVVDRTLSLSPLDDVAQGLQKVQAWLNSTSRDVLDESDEILHVRYQLIYTMHEQQPFDDGPDRWTTTQKIFDLVRRHGRQLHEAFPEEVEILENRYEGEFSRIRLLGASASEALVSQIAEDALNGALDSLTLVGLGAQPLLRTAVFRFIKEHSIDSQTYDTVQDLYRKSGLWKSLLLVRGLLAHGILIYVLRQRRWRVDYGLDSKRSLLAVPYRAKDVPSLRSDFGHPDVIVCLTCLSYYYGGLTPSQVRECFELLRKLDNPPLEYEKWVKRGGRTIPVFLRQLIGVNTKDLQTFTNDVIPIFQHNQAVIDFFLSQVVFPKEAKEFPSKLGTSGWDLAQHRVNFTTGFSGTNDNSDLLPTSITQRDPVNQLQTNAQVLGYLLRSENSRYIRANGANGQPCSVKEFLEILVGEQQEIRVLLDVGAQMLEMTNRQLIEQWLSLVRSDIEAGVFFNDADQLSVLSRDGVVEPLYSSSFSQRLDQCIIYLDDAHTRGTDLRLPLNFRAMVTLGPKVTKDRLVQGCMRMRKLGYGQSVVFCAPPEVDRRIREAENIGALRSVNVIDVLSWVMCNTCSDIEHHIPHWVQQGVDYHRRGCDIFSASRAGVKRLKKAWLRPAARSLEEMYGFTTNEVSSNTVSAIPAMHERLRILGVKTVRYAGMEEEQEREVSHELEQELELERPPSIPAAVHRLDEEVRRFVQQGTIRRYSQIISPLMTPLRSESQTLSPQNPWSRQLLATRDFMTTTSCGTEQTVLTEYLRPVNWIVSCVSTNGDTILVVMSPYEVNSLLRDIRASKHVRLHMYAPRTIQDMKPFDDLTFYCVPPLSPGNPVLPFASVDVRCQLNIWAGQLYLDEYKTYLRLCLLLGVSSSETAEYSSVEIDRFVPTRGRIGEMVDVCLFDESPLTLLKTLIGLRRKGMSHELTHMGKIMNARLLAKEDFEK